MDCIRHCWPQSCLGKFNKLFSFSVTALLTVSGECWYLLLLAALRRFPLRSELIWTSWAKNKTEKSKTEHVLWLKFYLNKSLYTESADCGISGPLPRPALQWFDAFQVKETNYKRSFYLRFQSPTRLRQTSKSNCYAKTSSSLKQR